MSYYDKTVLFLPNYKMTYELYQKGFFSETRKRLLEKFNGNIVKPARTTFCYEIK